MASDDTKLTVDVQVDSEEIINGVKEIINNTDKNLTLEEKAEKKELLLELMTHAYDEEVRRNELVDSKNSQMIILTGAMLTLQSTLFSNIIVDNVILTNVIEIKCKVIISIVMIVSLSLYTCSMYLFIDAYIFKERFKSVPNPDLLQYFNESKDDNSNVIEELLKEFQEAINFNANELIDKKVEKGKKGFYLLEFAVGSTILLLIIVLIILF